MVTLRNFIYDDAIVLQKFLYTEMSVEEIQSIICNWNKREYHGKYFEMFAIIYNGAIIGTISLFQRSDKIISIGTEVFSAYQRQGLGKRL